MSSRWFMRTFNEKTGKMSTQGGIVPARKSRMIRSNGQEKGFRRAEKI
jgi:hypothetical protein